MNPALMMILASIARTLLASASGYAVGKGYIDSETATSVVGAIGTVAVGAWGVWQKTRVEKK